MNGNYDDIINLPHHVSQKHPRMSMIDRAAQFSPFAALTGHGAAIEETARLTDKKTVLDENKKEIINEKLRIISECGDEISGVEVTHFVPDIRKTGGEYVVIIGKVKKIDGVSREIIMSDGKIIPLENVYDIRFIQKQV